MDVFYSLCPNRWVVSRWQVIFILTTLTNCYEQAFTLVTAAVTAIIGWVTWFTGLLWCAVRLTPISHPHLRGFWWHVARWLLWLSTIIQLKAALISVRLMLIMTSGELYLSPHTDYKCDSNVKNGALRLTETGYVGLRTQLAWWGKKIATSHLFEGREWFLSHTTTEDGV